MHINTLFQAIFFSPHILLKKCLAALPSKHPASQYPYRIISIQAKRSTYYFKFQIINSRATFEANLKEVFMNSHLLSKLTPTQVYKIGYYAKKNEIDCINGIKNKRQIAVNKYLIHERWVSIIKSIFITIQKRGAIRNHPEKKHYELENSYLKNRELNLIFRISDTSITFDIPFTELLKDFTMIKNVSINDLIKIGYTLKEKECDIE